MLVVEEIEGKRYRDYKEVAKKLNIPYDDLNGEELQNKYPLLNFKEDHQAMYDPSAGVLIPDKCQFALQVNTLMCLSPKYICLFICLVSPADPVYLFFLKGSHSIFYSLTVQIWRPGFFKDFYNILNLLNCRDMHCT